MRVAVLPLSDGWLDAAKQHTGGRGVDVVVACVVIKTEEDASIMTVSRNGYGKRTKLELYRVQSRGGKGIINLKVTKKTGVVVGLKVVQPGQELMLITTEGIVIRTDVDDISVISRNTQGVMLMKTESGDKVASLATMEQKSE